MSIKVALGDDAKKEQGRELKPSELREKTVVIISPPVCENGHHAWITMWVKFVGKGIVVFWSGTLGVNVVNFVRGDELVDGNGQQVKVYEYLGEI